MLHRRKSSKISLSNNERNFLSSLKWSHTPRYQTLKYHCLWWWCVENFWLWLVSYFKYVEDDFLWNNWLCFPWSFFGTSIRQQNWLLECWSLGFWNDLRLPSISCKDDWRKASDLELWWKNHISSRNFKIV